MGTRSRIAVATAKGFTSIYCHWDGGPEHNGRILYEAYSRKNLPALLRLGDISSLGRKIGRKHDFDKRPEDTVTAYKRDRGETGTEAIESPDLASLFALAEESDANWLYVWADGRWFYTPVRTAPCELKPLTPVAWASDVLTQ